MKKLNSNNIFIQNDYIDEVLNNLDAFEMEETLLLSRYTPYKNKIYDYILLNYAYFDNKESFVEFLINFNEYNDYINRICIGNNVILKANLVIYLENNLFYSLFDNVADFIDKVVNYDDYKIQYKIDLLIEASLYKCSDNDILNIKKNIRYLLTNDINCKDKLNNEELNYLIEYYNKQIDTNHIKALANDNNKKYINKN